MRKRRVEPAPRERLTRGVVARAAIDLADAEGLEAVTTRRLAAELGVTPMALYHHFKDKNELLDGVVESVLAEVALAEDGEGGGAAVWDARLRGLLGALVAVFAAHPAVAGLVKNRMLHNDPGREITERLLASLRAGGFTAEQASQFAVTAVVFITNLVTDMPGLAVGTSAEEREQAVRTMRAHLQALPPKRFPHIIGSAAWLTDCAASERWLSFGLDTLMAGIGAQATEAAPAVLERNDMAGTLSA